jgi:hypothetical protein
MQANEMGWFNIKVFMISGMREIWLEAWLTRYGLRVWMASSMIGKNDPPGLQCNDRNLVLDISMDRV